MRQRLSITLCPRCASYILDCRGTQGPIFGYDYEKKLRYIVESRCDICNEVGPWPEYLWVKLARKVVMQCQR